MSENGQVDLQIDLKNQSGHGLYMKYFVLKPAGRGPYAAASRAALKTYALVIKETDQLLANQLMLWVEKESM